MNLKEIFPILKKAGSDWMEDQASTLGAALAYYTVFSLAPLLIIAIAIAGLVFGQEAAQGQIFEQLRGLLGEASAKAMQDMVQNANAKPATGVVATLIGVVTLLFWCIGGIRSVADLTQCDLGRGTKAWAGYPWPYPGSDPLFRLYLGRWLPALGFSSSYSSRRSCSTVVRRHAPSNGGACSDPEFCSFVGGDYTALCHDI